MLGRLYKMIRYAIRLLLPADKPPSERTMDEVKAILANMADKSEHKRLNWDTSLVDLCKLLEIDPSMASRREMYESCNGAGRYTGTAVQNVWLHGQVMDALARDGFGE